MTRNQGPAPYWIDPDSPEIFFPDVETALREPDGLLAVGGDLKPERLLLAYRNGIFPWFGPDQPILWWAPDPRLVLFPEQLKISRSLSRTLRKQRFIVTFDTAFAQVVHACAAPRPGQAGTWITPEMQSAYRRMHELGHAHSVECWQHGELVGGLYGIAIGHVFFGESMFTRVADASKVGFVTLVQQLQASGYRLIDCQVHTDHLESLGAMMIPRPDFTRLLASETRQMTDSHWIAAPADS
ncbi:MAG TPA: leucyl/phenylalanyl-tRNA--protein transferase [Gammaproteobacteria bacterium]|jgi:leucyl/phenylalanyl-tRNA--protein transferase|nr:leucyl/phenylalanyl-tRNA--protein transferase [Gammaproteobacteria bacterium]